MLSTSHARGVWFKPQRLHSSFSIRSIAFVPEPPGLLSRMGLARIGTTLFIISIEAFRNRFLCLAVVRKDLGHPEY